MKEIVSNFGFFFFLCFLTSSVYAVALFKSSYKLLAFQCKHLARQHAILFLTFIFISSSLHFHIFF